MVKTTATHTCEVCRREYDTLSAAQLCEAQVNPPRPPVGMFVGFGTHGWWDGRRRWVLFTPRPEPDQWNRNHHPSITDRGAVLPWAKAPADAIDRPVVNWWLPIYRVTGSVVREGWGQANGETFYRHELRVGLWSPAHANTRDGGERQLAAQLGGAFAFPVPPSLRPAMTPMEVTRFHELARLHHRQPQRILSYPAASY